MEEKILTNGIMIKSDVGINLESLSGREQPKITIGGKEIGGADPRVDKILNNTTNIKNTAQGGAIGYDAYNGAGFSGGKGAKSEKRTYGYIDNIQLGEGTNKGEKTLQVYNHRIMDSSGNLFCGSVTDKFGNVTTAGKKVLHVGAQTLTEAEQTQVKTNLGITSGGGVSYDPYSNYKLLWEGSVGTASPGGEGGYNLIDIPNLPELLDAIKTESSGRYLVEGYLSASVSPTRENVPFLFVRGNFDKTGTSVDISYNINSGGYQIFGVVIKLEDSFGDMGQLRGWRVARAKFIQSILNIEADPDQNIKPANGVTIEVPIESGLTFTKILYEVKQA